MKQRQKHLVMHYNNKRIHNGQQIKNKKQNIKQGKHLKYMGMTHIYEADN